MGSAAVNHKNTVILLGILLVLSAAFVPLFTGWPMHHVHAPAMSQGWNFEYIEESNGKFTRVLHSEYPLGSSATRLRTRLMGQGFVRPGPHLRDDCSARRCAYADTRNELEYGWGAFPCGRTLRVRWKADANGLIIDLSGEYFSSCI